MALSNQQYESLMRQYELTRDENRRVHMDRLQLVLNKVPEYQALENALATASIDKTARLIDGDFEALNEFRRYSEEVKRKKRELLVKSGFPADYLEPVYTCPDCKDTGYLDNNKYPKEKCHCLKERELSILYSQSNIKEQLARENFSTLSYEYYEGEDLLRFQKAVECCKDFVQNFKQDYRNLFFYGTVGTGKSFLSGCIAAELLKKGQPVIYFNSSSLFDTLARYTFDSKSKESLYNFCQDLYNCELVILDDLGTEVTNSFVTSQLFTLLNERQLRRKSTIISTNLSLAELQDRYSDRVFSRITSNFSLFKLTGPDVRMRRREDN